ncbi:MAG: 1-deoxy-D-xylulose-5-phosphate synthase [Clostridia bacterium]|nr:1-deoxy-D-xylulose-5-phosphate synthase [Clostridia bacterium]
MLKKINEPKDLKTLSTEEKEKLAEEIRQKILEIVSKNGGHLASNLGVVELTIALHSVFNTPKDRIIWDVGHQSYVHKILTGRKEQMDTLRQFKGLAGFPKTCESEYDAFNTGHSSTSISVGTGMARARDLLKEDYNVISVIGDGSLTGGMAEEALNDAGASKTKLIVILNDNEMSISKNVGGIPTFLSKLRTRKFYTNANSRVKRFTLKIPKVGEKIVDLVQRGKKTIKQIFIPNMYFEDIGFTYLGPVDGHNIEKLENILEIAKEVKGPVLVHVITKKGKGYKIAEENPDKFHGISPFNIETGEKLAPSKKDYSKVFGEKLVELAKKDEKIVAVTAAMKDGTGLKEFAKEFPDRFFDVGIAEQHAVGLVAGMAKAGLKPVLPLYSSFLQRGYDQLIHDVALQNIPVTICIDRAGLVGNDGETHHGIFDMSFASAIPNLTIMAPKDFKELEEMLEFGINFNGPVLIRYPRGGEGKNKAEKNDEIVLGKSELIKEGKDISIIAIGKMVDRAIEVSKLLKEKDIGAEVINVRFLKPLDKENILKSIEKTKKVVTMEDGILNGGLYTNILDLINRSNIENVKVTPIGYDDCFITHGSVDELEKEMKTDVKSIVDKINNN